MNKSFSFYTKALACLALGALHLSALAQVPLNNPSFETPTLEEGQTISPVPDGFGWTIRGNVSLVNGPKYMAEVPMGNQWALMRSGTAISQQVTLQAGTNYFVTLHAVTADGTAGAQTIRVTMNGASAPVLTPTNTVAQQTFASFSIGTTGTYTLQIDLPDPPAGGSNGLLVDNIVLNTQGTNSAPSVAISLPVDGRSYPDVSMTVVATAIDPDGTISKVEFYDTTNSVTTLLGTATSPPYQLNLTLPTVGTKNLTAKAYDNLNAFTTCTAVAISHSAGTAKPYVANGGFEYPRMPFQSVIGSYPYYNAVPWETTGGFIASSGGLAPGTSDLVVAAFTGRQSGFADGRYPGVGIQQPINLPAGQYGLSFSGNVAWQNFWQVEFGGVGYGGGGYPETRHAATITSAGGPQYLRFYTYGLSSYGAFSTLDNVKIGPIGVPIVTTSVVAPGTTNTFTAPTAIRLRANIEVYDRTITQVQFFNGTTLIGSGSQANPTFDWLNVPPGSYSVTTKATDSKGAVTPSAPITITVNAPSAPAFFNAGFEYGQDWSSSNWTAMVGWTPIPFTSCYYCAIGVGKGSSFMPAGTIPPEGIALALIKGGGWMQQAVYMPEGNYKIGFKAAQLGGGTGQSFQVLVNGTVVGTFTPGGAFANYQTGQFTIGTTGTNVVGSVGMQTIKFESTTPGIGSYVGIDSLDIIPQISVPGAPTIGTASANNGSANVTYAAPSSDGGSAVTTYVATSSPGGFTGTCTAICSSITISGLTNGVSYTFTVKAGNVVGVGPASASSNVVTPATIPGAPMIGAATAGNAQGTVTFTAPVSNGGSAITGYTATCGTQSASGAVSPITVVGLTNGAAVTCTVKASNAIGTGAISAASNSITPSTVPGTPLIGTALAGNVSAIVAFSEPANNGGSTVTGYDANCGGISASGSESPITVSGLTNGSLVNCTVRAINAKGSSSPSAPSNSVVPAPTVPGPPTMITATASHPNASVSFAPPANDGGYPITSYDVKSMVESRTVQGTGSPIIFPAIICGPEHTFRVRATNALGTGPWSSPSNEIGYQCSSPFVAPVIGTATPGNGQATVTFSQIPAEGNGGPPVMYYLAKPTPGDVWGELCSAPCNSIVITGLTNGTSYSFKVQAINALGLGLPSAASNSVVPFPGGALSELYYVHADHLGTPRAITNSYDNSLAWKWDNADPFGNNPANEDPLATGNAFNYNLRFAGQYYDEESGTHYNYHRDYDPSTGRYRQSDPIGLVAGLNTYGYVDANPISTTDSYGLIAPWLANLLAKGAEYTIRYTPTITALAADLAGVNGTLSSFPAVATSSRALLAADLGIKGEIKQLCGTISMNGRTLNLTVDMIEATIKNRYEIVPNLIENATRNGATEIRIQATIANEALLNLLTKKYGFEVLKGEGKYQEVLVKQILVNQIPK